MDNKRLAKYIGIEEQPNVGKRTKIWQIYNRGTMDICGYVKWYGGWRKYIFETVDRERIYDWEFLRFVADYCESQTKQHYNLKNN